MESMEIFFLWFGEGWAEPGEYIVEFRGFRHIMMQVGIDLYDENNNLVIFTMAECGACH